MIGNAKSKRQSWLRKKGFRPYEKFSIKKCKKKFQRKIRNGKVTNYKSKGCGYKRCFGWNAKGEYMP